MEGIAAAVQIFRVARDVARFFFRVPHALHADFLARIALGPQRLAEAALVRRDQARGRAEDGGRGAVIALEADHLRAGKIALEAQDVLHLRAAPAIDRLVVVADHADIAGRAREQLEPQILHDVGVLILVHQHVFEAVAIVGEDFRLRAQDGQRVEQQIAEVRGVQRFQPLLILAIELAALAEREAVAFAFRHGLRRQPLVLPLVDHRGQRARGPALLVDIRGLKDLLHQAKLIVGIENGEIGFEAGKFRMAAQNLRADGMEGAEPLHPLDHAADQRADALLHFARGLVGEGDAKNLPRPGAARGEDVCEPRGQHARLAGSRAGQHQHRPVHGLDRLALLRVQAGEIRRLPRNRPSRIRSAALSGLLHPRTPHPTDRDSGRRNRS